MPGARLVDDLEVALHRARPIEQERRQRIRQAARATPTPAGFPVPLALNVNRPRGPPASCVCSSMSVFFRHSPPNFTVCLFISLVTEPTTFHVFSQRSHGWLAEKPRSGSP